MAKKFLLNLTPILLITTIPILLTAQFQYSGSIHPSSMFHLDDASDISLPFRLAEAQLGYTFANIDVLYSGALEYRWSESNDAMIDSPEIYLAWYPDWGEFRLGKQIISWGAVDGNNPTDNVNPYDFYYLFSPGSERKIGTFLAAVTYYWNDWSIQGIVIPEHNPNRMVYDEEDFPIPIIDEDIEVVDDEDIEVVDISNPLEFGIQTSGIFGETDISFTYFNGYDRAFSIVGLIFPYAGITNPQFGYRRTQMLGIDIVHFIGDFGFRGEAAYFNTNNQYKNFSLKLETKAQYFQYALEVESPGLFDSQLMSQLIGTHIISAEGFDITNANEIHDISDSFQPGMGTPFAMFSDLALMLTASGSHLDDQLEVDIFSLINLDDAGLMLGGELSYSQFDNLKLELGVSKFIGNDDHSNLFTQLEDFSHFRLGMKYSF